MQTATADPLLGRVLEGRYRIRERIARGGMSTVYRAVDERLDRLVAVKVMSDALSSDPAFADRFAREARTAAKLSHLNAVSVYDQGSDAGHVFLVMELVAGRTLRDLIRDEGALSPAQAVSIMEPVLGALAAAHRAGLVHRDVKPENILLSDDGVVKVADFGLARAVETDAASTRTGLMMGTVAYCAPEQVSQGRADQRSDVYSAGIVLFELLTGRAPFTGESAMAVAYQHVHNRVPAPSSRGRPVPEPLDALVIAATDRDPTGRPADAGAFLAELHDVRAELRLPIVPVPPRRRPTARPVPGAPTGTGSPGYATAQLHTTDRLPPGARRHDTALAQPLLAGPFPARPGPPPRTAQQPPPMAGQPPARRRRWRRNVVILVVLLLLGGAAGYACWWFASGRYKHVPRLGGEPKATALAALRQAGLTRVSIRDEYSETVGKDAVITTSPVAGARVLPKDTVTVVVSLGKQRWTLPKVSGTEAQARHALAACPFPLQIVASQRSDDSVPKGTVIGTDPPQGTEVKPGQAVTIIVSTGPPLVGVPDVTGQSQGDATNTLQNAGFKVAVQQAFSDTVPEGQVISENPPGGGQQVKFSTVTITVSQGPPIVTVPDIAAGTPVDDARGTLTGLGLKVKVRQEFGGQLGEVVGMDPPAGTQLHKGDTVTLYVV